MRADIGIGQRPYFWGFGAAADSCEHSDIPMKENPLANGPVDLVIDRFASDHVSAVLHHYCSTETFMAIVASKSIRLSALSMSNDSEEGRLVLRLTRSWVRSTARTQLS